MQKKRWMTVEISTLSPPGVVVKTKATIPTPEMRNWWWRDVVQWGKEKKKVVVPRSFALLFCCSRKANSKMLLNKMKSLNLNFSLFQRQVRWLLQKHFGQLLKVETVFFFFRKNVFKSFTKSFVKSWKKMLFRLLQRCFIEAFKFLMFQRFFHKTTIWRKKWVVHVSQEKWAPFSLHFFKTKVFYQQKEASFHEESEKTETWKVLLAMGFLCFFKLTSKPV